MVQRSYSDERQPRPLGALKQTAAREPTRPYPGSHQAILYSDLRKSQVPNRKKLLIKPPLPKRVVAPETTTAQVNTQAASAENAQTTDELFESSEKRKSQNEVPKKGNEQVGEQGKKKKTTIADLNQQAKDKREAKQITFGEEKTTQKTIDGIATKDFL